MRMTPLEIQNHQFSRRLSGLDPEEVASFLSIVADDYENALRENERLKDTVHQLEKRNDELASGEKILRETLVSAQAMAEKLRETAVAESEVLLSTAEVRAEKILDASHRRAATLSEEIRELRGLRKRYASSLRSTIDTHLTLIDRLEREEEEPIPHLTGVMRKYRMTEVEREERIQTLEVVPLEDEPDEGAEFRDAVELELEAHSELAARETSEPKRSEPRQSAPPPTAPGGP